ncbi:MAG TPA: choice-of-anchor D domain-containing protein [Candidatus Acidoferrum sp.]|nr:choice-of-anchor D domain-containing protein [Candidatus Acidoferrum sp.]
MATRIETFPLAPLIIRTGIPQRMRTLRLFVLLSILLGMAPPASAQTSQQYVYASVPQLSPASSAISGFNKASQSGALSLIPGSPFNERFEGGLVAIDGQGKFLFVLNPKSDDISMFLVNQASGALSEVQGSPFAVPPTVNPSMAPSLPLSIAAEQSGKFLFVGYLSGDFQGQSSVASLAISTSGSSPALLAQQSIPTNSGGAPVQLLTDAKGVRLYVGLQHGQNGVAVGGAEVYSIDPSTGKLAYQGMADILPGDGESYAIDPQARFIYGGERGISGSIQSCVISPVDGTANNCPPLLDLGVQVFPAAIIAENAGHFLYVQGDGTGNGGAGVRVYSIDQVTGALTQVLGPLTATLSGQGSVIADPMGPYIYSFDLNGSSIHAFQVDQVTGNLSEIPGSPFSVGGAPLGCCGGIAISGTPVHTVSGPAVSIFPSTAATFSSPVGSTSPTQVFSMINVGSQLLTINSISIGGTNAASFSQSNTCTATLAPNANCSVSISFTPPSAGTFAATLQVADNAPGTPQTLVLNGTGVAAAPAVTFSPATLSFPATNQGTSGAPQTLTVINSGNAPLHVSSVSLSGPNPSDFSFVNNCNAPVASASNCTISLVFTPTAPGQRTANLLISDDAPGSPQTLLLSATGIATVPAITFSPAALSFPVTTQGTSSVAQTLTVTNSGNATLHVSSISLGGLNPSEFSFVNNCTAPVAPASNCTISLVFGPVASGQRTANLLISDDVSGSPQGVSLSATANPAFTGGAAPGGSTSASVSPGQTAQYSLQLTPGPGFNGTVSLACSGAPFAATCQAPATLTLANGASALFTVTVSTKGPALFPPQAPLRRLPPFSMLPLAALILAFLISIVGSRTFETSSGRNRMAFCGVLSAFIFCAFLGVAGCGGGSAALAPAVAPPSIVTPSGTSTITITLAATSSSGQPLQLPSIQLTLIVQ